MNLEENERPFKREETIPEIDKEDYDMYPRSAVQDIKARAETKARMSYLGALADAHALTQTLQEENDRLKEQIRQMNMMTVKRVLMEQKRINHSPTEEEEIARDRKEYFERNPLSKAEEDAINLIQKMSKEDHFSITANIPKEDVDFCAVHEPEKLKKYDAVFMAIEGKVFFIVPVCSHCAELFDLDFTFQVDKKRKE